MLRLFEKNENSTIKKNLLEKFYSFNKIENLFFNNFYKKSLKKGIYQTTPQYILLLHLQYYQNLFFIDSFTSSQS